jgi:hypothetical protein
VGNWGHELIQRALAENNCEVSFLEKIISEIVTANIVDIFALKTPENDIRTCETMNFSRKTGRTIAVSDCGDTVLFLGEIFCELLC